MFSRNNELATLENEFRSSVNQFRSMLRWGVDKAYSREFLDTEKLLKNVHSNLQAKNARNAKQLLEDISKKIHAMESGFKTTRARLIEEVLYRIEFMDCVLGDMLDLNITDAPIPSRSKLVRELEKARLALQSEDWQSANSGMDQVLGSYLRGRQLAMQRGSLPRLDEDNALRLEEKLDGLLSRGAMRKNLNLAELKGLIGLTGGHEVTSVNLALLAAPEHIADVFDKIGGARSTQVAGGTAKPVRVIRIPVNRSFVVYVNGISLADDVDSLQLRSLLPNFSAVLLDFDRGSIATEQVEQTMVSCFDSLHSENIFHAGTQIREIIEESPIEVFADIVENHAEVEDPVDFVSWLKHRLVHDARV